eukprot:9748182-Alexandrium_andersonii.AAC.1
MSASLVGSEMCIRDSISPRPPSRPRVVPWRTPFLLVPEMRAVAAALSACLLYTSDAADDM